MLKELYAAQVESILFLSRHGFPELALSLADDLRDGFPKPDVLACVTGIVLAEGLGRGPEAYERFAEACRMCPDYPQALRLAAIFAPDADTRAGMDEKFLSVMQRPMDAPDSHREAIRHRTAADEGYRTLLLESPPQSADRMSVFYCLYLKSKLDGASARALSFGSLLSQLEGRIPRPGSRLPQDSGRKVWRDCVATALRLHHELDTRRQLYGKTVASADNLILRDAVLQGQRYLATCSLPDTSVLNRLACASRMLGFPEDCLAYCEKAMEAQPGGGSYPCANKALALGMLGRTQEAEAMLPYLERASWKPDALDALRQRLRSDRMAHTHTLGEVSAGCQRMLETSRSAAREEEATCRRTGRIAYLRLWIEPLRTGHTASAEMLSQQTALFTPTLLYHTLAQTLRTRRESLNALLMDAASLATAKRGYQAEATAELCWYFALAPDMAPFTEGLRQWLLDHAAAPSVAAAAARVHPFLPAALTQSVGSSLTLNRAEAIPADA